MFHVDLKEHWILRCALKVWVVQTLYNLKKDLACARLLENNH